MLTGQAKTDYQRGYMRRRRSNKKAQQEPNLLDLADVAVLDPPRVDRNQDARDRLAATPLAKLEAMDAWIPGWRIEQGHNP